MERSCSVIAGADGVPKNNKIRSLNAEESDHGQSFRVERKSNIDSVLNTGTMKSLKWISTEYHGDLGVSCSSLINVLNKIFKIEN